MRKFTIYKTIMIRNFILKLKLVLKLSSLLSSLLSLLLLLLLLPSIAQTCCAQQTQPLNEYISHYETLSYTTVSSDSRSKRSTHSIHSTHDELIEIGFSAHGRHFPMRLRRDANSVFHNDLVIESSDGKPLSVNLDHIVSGELWNEPRSVVYGSIGTNDGVFEGKIYSDSDDETFYVERAAKYFTANSSDIFNKSNGNHNGINSDVDIYYLKSNNNSLPFHSVIYSAKHVTDPYGHKRSIIDGACGADESTREWMSRVSNSAVDDEEGVSRSDDHSHSRSKRSSRTINYWTSPYEAQGRIGPANKPTQSPPIRDTPFVPQRRACSLYIQTDTYLWDHIKKNEPSDAKAREEIASLVAQHIKAVNHIYETSVFKDIIGLKFIVQRLKINDTSACNTSVKRESNPFCSPNIDVSNFLNLNSQFNHNDFCLAYIFTYRDFSGGTLGLAWVASTSGASGGICEKYKSYTENIGGRQVQTKRSLNTGIITFVNYNSRVPPKVSELTLAHEIGHNFGSPHDYPLDCRPGGSLGNFIMYSSATSGERPNNNKFSVCSVNNISSVLHAVFNNEGKDNCFQEDNGPFCGNKIVEEGEECDCGYDVKECSESCCYPREVEPFLSVDSFAKACHRRPTAKCSPSEGPCCTEDCNFEVRAKQCRHESECNYESFCNGYNAFCPRPPPKPNKTECNGGTQVCWRGECVGSICQKYDLEECFLTAKKGAKADEMCEVACQNDDSPDSCRRTSEIHSMKNISGLKLRPGSPCNEFQGYCDVFQRCRAVDAEGPLARLKNLLLNQKTLMSIKQWVITYWWACLLMLVAMMLFMAAFIKCCAVHTPSSNPKKRPALRLSDTLRRPADTLRRKRNRQQSSSRESRSHQQQQQPLAPSVAQTASSLSAVGLAPIPGTLQMQVNPHSPPTLVVALPPTAMDPPPPYTASRVPTAPPMMAGPSHGYGDGRGHYNRHGQSNVPTNVKPMGNGRPLSAEHSNSVPNANKSVNKHRSDYEMKSRRS